MPEITIPQKELDKVKQKIGVYGTLRRPNAVPPPIKFSDVLLPVIESAFREYARAHRGCTKDMEDKEWKNFLTKLKKRL